MRKHCNHRRGDGRRKGGGCLWAFVLLPLVYYGLYFLKRDPLPFQPEVIAHRGGPATAPENTRAAFRNAIELGVDRLELDVHMTKGGGLVVIHDETVDRTTNGTGRVADMSLADLRALDAGNGEKIPTFKEVIDLAQKAGVGLLPEIKSPHLYPGIEEKVLQTLAKAGYSEHTIIQSFDPQSIEKLHALAPQANLCQLYGQGVLSVTGAQPGHADRVCLMAEMVVLNPWMIQQNHQEGRQVFVWFGVIEHPLVMRFILALGADGLIVDDPAALIQILGR